MSNDSDSGDNSYQDAEGLELLRRSLRSLNRVDDVPDDESMKVIVHRLKQHHQVLTLSPADLKQRSWRDAIGFNHF